MNVVPLGPLQASLPFHDISTRVRFLNLLTYPTPNSIHCAALLHSMASLEDLQDEWNHLYRTQLPSLAKAKSPSQPKWPVRLDHCFARIILDNTVGKDKPWNQVVKSPAYKNMSRQQLEDAIQMGTKVAKGEEDLVELDEKSLALRGKMSKRKKGTGMLAKKRKFQGEEDGEVQSTEKTPHKAAKRPSAR